MQTHVDMTHGTHRWYVSALNTFLELSPYVPTCTEKRAVVERFSNAQQHASADPENDSHRVQPSPEAQLSLAWGRIFHRCAEALPDVSNAQDVFCTMEWHTRQQEVTNGFSEDVDCGPSATRSFSACVFCAMLHWSEDLTEVFLAGPRCDIPDPPRVARLLDVQCYHEMWPLIPLQELEASAVDFTYTGEDGAPALLRFREVETFFHEFGHVMHCVLSESKYSVHAWAWPLCASEWLGECVSE